jgi:hypothetical protein
MGIWDIFQDWDLVPLRDLEAETSRLKNAAERDADRLYDLNRRVTQLAMVSAALWELLKKKADLSEDDLRRTLEEINASGKTPPGAAPPDQVYCPSCNHQISPTVNRCVYCGAAVTPQTTARFGGGAQANVVLSNHAYCPACRHEISPTVNRCIYCGATVTPRGAPGP